MPRLARVALLLLVAGLLVPLGSSPASAVLPSRGIMYDNSASDADLAERDWFTADVSHDPTTGRVWGTYDLGAEPSSATAATFRVWIGNEDGSTCRAFALVTGTTLATAARTTARAASGRRTPATAQRAVAADQRRALGVDRAFESTGPSLAAPANCFWFDIAAGPETTAAIYDGAEGEFGTLETIDPTTLMESSEGARVVKGKWATVPVAVDNTGDIPATGVTVTLRATSKVKAKRSTITLGTIAPGASATARFSVRLTGGSSRSVTYDVTADDGVETEVGSFELATTPKPPKASGNLAGLYLWRSEILTGVRNWDNHGLFFVNKKYAYRGFPEAGLPTCRKVTASLSGDGCVRYWYDARTRRLQVDTERGKSLGPKGRPDGVKIGKDAYTFELVMPKKGTRLSVSLKHQEAYMCPGVACTTSTTTIAMNRDGSYGVGASAGTYAIGRNGQIVLSRADGTRDTSTIWIQTDRKGKAQPSREGIILGDVNYYP